jgi:hypothetical protein
MSIVLNGTTGITNDGGYTGDGVSFADTTPANTLVTTTDGNVGVGTASPSFKLDAHGAGNSTVGRFYSPSGTSAVRIETAGNDKAVVEYYTNGNGNWRAGPGITTAGAFEFNSVTANATRMLIDSSGNLLVGTTTNRGKITVEANSGNCRAVNALAGTGTFDLFSYIGTTVGSITTGGTSTFYNTSSDYRLKENIAPMTGALATVSALKPVTYKWKFDGSNGQGFIAHELAEVVPECVVGEKDAVDAEGNIKPQGIDTSFLVATLTASIQELKAIVDAQAARIAALESAGA